MEFEKQKIKKVFKRATKIKQIHESVLLVENTNGDFSVRGKGFRYTIPYGKHHKAVYNHLYFYFEGAGQTVTRR